MISELLQNPSMQYAFHTDYSCEGNRSIYLTLTAVHEFTPQPTVGYLNWKCDTE